MVDEEEIQIIREDLQRIKENFEILRDSGINREILQIYLHHKTKVSLKKITEILDSTDEFFINLFTNGSEEE